MSKNQETSERIKQWLVVAATVGVIFVNFLAANGYVNNTSPGAISDKYPTLLTPAGYAFSIWSLIYLGVIVFSVYQVLPSQTANPLWRKIRSLYIGSCAANCAWIFAWHYDLIFVALALIFLLLGTLALINLNLRDADSSIAAWLARAVFGIYFGWVTVASIVNATIALRYARVEMSDMAATVWACVLITAAAILGVFLRLKLPNGGYALAVAWALAAIAVKQSENSSVAAFAAVAAVVLLIAFSIPFLRTKPR